jgi:hypothetical protein
MLRYAGMPLGHIELDAGEPAAGFLEPLPSYEALRESFQLAGDLLWTEHFLRLGPPSPRLARAMAEADAMKARLELATLDGTQLPVGLIDLADAKRQGEPPFVLVYFRSQPATVLARVAPPERPGHDGSRPAA